jgi:sugar lactone lactonase YvrE
MLLFCPLSTHSLGDSARRRRRSIWMVTALAMVGLSASIGLAQAISRVQVIETFSGDGTPGFSGDNGPATGAQLNNPSGVATDSAGNLYIADTANHRIRKVAVGSGNISTVAGTGTAGYSGDNGPASAAELHSPAGIALDSAGNLYVADQGNGVIRKVTASGTITTVAGNNETGFSGDNGPATNATLYKPAGVAVDSAGNLYIADTGNNRIREVNTSGVITTIAGNGTAGYNGDNGPATSASLNQPSAVLSAGSGILYLADTANQVIRQVGASGTITTVAGNGIAAYTGDGGPATSASLHSPVGLAVDGSGNLYIADSGNNAIRLLSSAGAITTVVGTGVPGFSGDGGPASAAQLDAPRSVAFDTLGNLYVSDQGNNRVRQANTPAGSVMFPTTQAGKTSAAVTIPLQVNTSETTISSIVAPTSQAGKQEYTMTATGCALNTALAAGTVCNVTVTFTPAYPGLRAVPLEVNTPSETFFFGMAGIGNAPQAALTPGIINTVWNPHVGLNSLSIASLMGGIAVDASGNVYVPASELGSLVTINVLLKIAAGTGVVTQVSPAELTETGDLGMAIDSAGNLYVAAPNYHCIFKLAPGATEFTVVAGTLIGNGGFGGLGNGFSGDGGLAVNAKLDAPAGVAVDSAGNLYIADSGNNRIRKVNASGIITTIVGNGAAGDSGDGGPATNAEMNDPSAVAVDVAGNLYIADSKNRRVREVSVAGVIRTIAGNGTMGYTGDGGPATSGEMNVPSSVAVDPAGNVYIGDSPSANIRMVNAAGIITTVAGNGAIGETGDGGPATGAQINLFGVGLDSAGNLLIAGQDSVRSVNVAASALTFASAQISTGAMQGVVETNIGNAPLAFTVPVSGQNPSLSSGFTVDGSSSCPQLSPGSQGATLTPGASCSLVMDFSPTTTAAVTGTASIADNALYQNALQTVQLTGGAGVTVATTTALNVATPTVGQTAVSATVAATTGTVAPAGTIVFTVDGAAQPAVTLDSTGGATLPAVVSNALAVGSHTISAAYTSSSLTFDNSVATRIFSVSAVPPSVSIAAGSSSLSVGQGSSVTDTLTITPAGGYMGALQFSCQNLPQNASCSFQPGTLTLNAASGPQTTVVTIQTAGSSAQRRGPSPRPENDFPVEPAAAFWAPGMLLAAFARSRRRLSSFRRGVVFSVALFAGAWLATGCGGGSSSTSTTTPAAPTTPAASTTPTGTSTVQIVAAASGSTVQTFTVTLTVHN